MCCSKQNNELKIQVQHIVLYIWMSVRSGLVSDIRPSHSVQGCTVQEYYRKKRNEYVNGSIKTDE